MYKCKHFKIHELVPPAIYASRGEKAWMLLDEKALRQLDLLRDKFGSMTVNNYAFGGDRHWSGLRTSDSPYYSPTSQHCFDDKTEILTSDGWKSIDDNVDDLQVITVNPQTFEIENKNINSKSEFNYDGIMYGIKTKHVDSLSTDNHRNLCHTGKVENTKFEYSKNINNKRRFFFRSGKQSVHEKLTTIEKLAIATVCDGVIKDNNIHFHLSKNRKINEIMSYATELGCTFNKYSDKLKQNTVYITVPSYVAKQVIKLIGRNKSLEFTKVISNKAKAIIELYTFYDGNVSNRIKDKYKTISSINKTNIDILSMLAAIAGFSQVVSKYDLKDYETNTVKVNDIYVISLTGYLDTRVNKDKYYTRYYEGKVWCLNNDNTTLFVRRNGKVYISGNSFGRAFDCLFKEYTAEEVRKAILDDPDNDAFRFITSVELDVSWLHFDVRNCDRIMTYKP